MKNVGNQTVLFPIDKKIQREPKHFDNHHSSKYLFFPYMRVGEQMTTAFSFWCYLYH